MRMVQRRVGAVLMTAVVVWRSDAQFGCAEPVWHPTGVGVRDIDDGVHVVRMWDPDGEGPRAPQLIAGGEFNLAGNQVANSIASWDTGTKEWSALGEGVMKQPTFSAAAVYQVGTMEDGSLAVGGWFETAGGIPAHSIARWDGVAWHAFGTGLHYNEYSGFAFDFATLRDGSLVVGGEYLQAGGVNANHIARWDGSEWHTMGSGVEGEVAYTSVRGMALLQSGDLVVGGSFEFAGGVPVGNLAQWDGSSWSAFGDGMNSPVGELGLAPDGSLYAAGPFTKAGGVSAVGVARWDGTSWSALGAGLANAPNDMLFLGGSEVLFVGEFWKVEGMIVDGLARWDGRAWHKVVNDQLVGPESVSRLPSGEIVVGSTYFVTQHGEDGAVFRLARDGWESLSESGWDGMLRSIEVVANNDIVVGGHFESLDGVELNGIAREVGKRWAPMGDGLWYADQPGHAEDLHHCDRDGLLVAGSFTKAGSVEARGIAAWRERQWHGVGGGFGLKEQAGHGSVIAERASGEIVVAGHFDTAGSVKANNIAQWDGAQWSALGPGVTFTDGFGVRAMALMPDDSLIVGGGLMKHDWGNSYLLRWNGASWSLLPQGVNYFVSSMLPVPDGTLVVGGFFKQAGTQIVNRVAIWTGSTWKAMGSGFDTGYGVDSLCLLPNGTIAAAGYFSSTADPGIQGFALWDGTSWTGVPRYNWKLWMTS